MTDHDDLTQIKGIGSVTQQWLQHEFDTHTFADLAALPADELEDRLRAAGRITARSKIESWLAQAQQLAAEATPTAPPVEAATDSATAPPAESPAVAEPEAPADAPARPVKANGWKTVSTFIVIFEERLSAAGEPELRTQMHDMEADRTQTWPGVQTDVIAAWVRDQLAATPLADHLRAVSAGIETDAETPPVERPEEPVRALPITPRPDPQSGQLVHIDPSAPPTGRLAEVLSKATHLAGEAASSQPAAPSRDRLAEVRRTANHLAAQTSPMSLGVPGVVVVSSGRPASAPRASMPAPEMATQVDASAPPSNRLAEVLRKAQRLAGEG